MACPIHPTNDQTVKHQARILTPPNKKQNGHIVEKNLPFTQMQPLVPGQRSTVLKLLAARPAHVWPESGFPIECSHLVGIEFFGAIVEIAITASAGIHGIHGIHNNIVDPRTCRRP